MLKGTKYVTFYLHSWFVLHKFQKSLGAKEVLINLPGSGDSASSSLLEHLY